MELAGLVVLVSLLASPALAARTGISSLSQAQTTQTGSCDACLFGFRLLDDVLSDQAVQDDMVNFVLTRVCPAVGGGEKCTNLAEGLLPVVIDWIRMPATAWQFCSATGSCDSTQHASLKLALTTARQPKSKLDDPTQCALCKLVVGQVQQVLNNTAILDKINATAQQVCLQLPPDMAVMCANFVDEYEPLIAALIAHASPEELCEMLGVCAAQLMSRLSAAQLPPLQGDVQAIVSSAISKGAVPGLTGANMLTDSCDMCKMAVIEAHSIVVNPQIQSQLTNYTEALCDSFGPSFADTCKLYVDTYAPVVYSVLAQYLVPDTLCVEIGVCPPPSKVLEVLGSLLSSVRTAIGTNTEANHLVTQHVAEAAARKWARQQAV